MREPIRIGPLEITFLVEAADSNGGAAVFEALVPAGSKVPAPHSHDGYEETVYGVAGVSTWTVEGEVHELAAGDAICIPRGAVHHFDNRGGADAKVLCIVTPGLLGPAYFRDVAAVVAGANGGPPDPARLAEAMRRHGLTPVPID